MKAQLNLFFNALIFFTRIPSPIKIEYSPEILNRSSRYYSLVGVVVGGVAGVIYYGSSFLFNHNIAILLSMISTVVITGAFHEDGFADSCDGLGGGYEKEQVLEIMKDSRIGTFGSIGLLLIILLKFFALLAINPLVIIPTMIVGHCFSRAISAGFIFSCEYVSSTKSKSKPLANKMKLKDFLLNLLVGYAVIFILFPQQYVMIGAITALLLMCCLLISIYIKKRIGGYTGDILGAIQQILEVLIYLFVGNSLWQFI